MREKSASETEYADSAKAEAFGYVKAPLSADELAERLSKLNRKQRRGIIARAKKAARVAAKKERGT